MSFVQEYAESALNFVYNSLNWMVDDLSATSMAHLNDGAEIPLVGLGVYKMSQDEAYQAVKAALKAGYRHIDTAWIYRNHTAVGQAVIDSGVDRKEIFITTKFFPSPKHGLSLRTTNGWGNPDDSYDECVRQVQQSLNELQLTYIDLLLVHTPSKTGDRLQTWRAMEYLKDQGLVRSIGVSNYGEHHLVQLLSKCVIRPAVNQCEMNPYITRTNLRDYCTAQGIVFESYSPLTKGQKLSDQKLLDIAAKYQRSPAQIMLRWNLQRGCVVLPKSVQEQRIVENLTLFDFVISDDDMAVLDAFDENLVTGWDPTQEPL